LDVARFLQVKKGLFFFDEAYRPVPLYKKFVGVRKPDPKKFRKQDRDAKAAGGDGKGKMNDGRGKGRGENQMGQSARQDNRRMDIRDVMDQVAFDEVMHNLYNNQQVLVFVHSRRDTIKLAQTFIDLAREKGLTEKFWSFRGEMRQYTNNLVNKDLKGLIEFGVGSHNAGLSRKDRKMMEGCFLEGKLRVVISTATLAWGVNLPAHAVVIKGTDVYEGGHGWKDVSILDVQQIFGRAGRPQYDTCGEATLITKIEKLNFYMGMMSSVRPIESHFPSCLKEALNAEIALDNVTSVSEAFAYIRKTFFYTRVNKSPLYYGIPTRRDVDSNLLDGIQTCLQELHHLRLIRLDEKNNFVESTELGRIASHFYINCATMERFCTYLNFYDDQANEKNEKGANSNNVNTCGDIEDQNLMTVLSQASEFQQLQTRQEEKHELLELKDITFLKKADNQFLTMIEKGDDSLGVGKSTGDNLTMDNVEKVMLLVQGYLSMVQYSEYSLQADTNYIVQNGTRILRCILEICLRKNLAD
jgi:activating signal cointegrator complex subunit 3